MPFKFGRSDWVVDGGAVRLCPITDPTLTARTPATATTAIPINRVVKVFMDAIMPRQ
jgi:hypothetical protein